MARPSLTGAFFEVPIIAPGRSPGHSTVLIDGVACLYERLQDGNRQIYAFQYPGDFCDLHRHVLPETNNEVAVAAIADCSIGIIEHKDLEQLIARYPSLGLALWRATMLEASIFRKRLLNVGRQPALQRVAHLLCEQLARREAVGLNSATIPLTQMDLADAAGLSIVHINRTFQELRRLNILSKEGRAIKVVDRERLAGLASFNGNYLNMPQLLSHWQVKIEPPQRQPNHRLPCGVRPLLQQVVFEAGCPKGRPNKMKAERVKEVRTAHSGTLEDDKTMHALAETEKPAVPLAEKIMDHEILCFTFATEENAAAVVDAASEAIGVTPGIFRA